MGVYGEWYCVSIEFWTLNFGHCKVEHTDALGKEIWSDGRPFKESDHLLIQSLIKKAFYSKIQEDFSCIPRIISTDS